MVKKYGISGSLAVWAVFLASGVAQAAVSLDLTSNGASGVINGATYTQVAPQPTGTGYIDPFVRVGMQGSAGKDVVQAYNTTVDGVFNNSNEDNYNHAIKVGDIGLLTVGGTQVMRFLLDINQTGADPKLNLDEVQIFISTAPNQSTTSFLSSGLLNLADSFLVYRMDGPLNGGGSPADNKATLDFSLNSGSGSGDMTLDIPLGNLNAAFTAGGALFDTTAEKNGAYIYLYSKFGSNPYTNNDGFEEWTHIQGAKIGDPPCTSNCGGGGGGNAPEPASLALVVLALAGAGLASRRRS